MSKKPILAGVATVVLAIGLMAGAGLIGNQGKKMATIKAGDGVVWAATQPTYSGIENIYIVDNAHASGFAQDLQGNENVLGVITDNNTSTTIPYETAFTIVPAVKVAQENTAYTQLENTKVELAVSGDFSIAQENSTDANEIIFGGSEGGSYIRYNVTQWDNTGAGYKITAGRSISIDSCRLWTWE